MIYLYHGIAARPFRRGVQSRRLRPGQAGVVPEWPVDRRPGPRGAGSDEAAPNFRLEPAHFLRPRSSRRKPLRRRSNRGIAGWKRGAHRADRASSSQLKERTMAIRDLIPWDEKNQELAPARDGFDPFLTLHREMNRLFDEVLPRFRRDWPSAIGGRPLRLAPRSNSTTPTRC